MEPSDISRLKYRAEEVLRSFYGTFNVWDVTFTSFTRSRSIDHSGLF